MDVAGDGQHPTDGYARGVDVNNDGGLVTVFDEHEGLDARVRSAIVNEGRDLELVSFIGGISEGSENARGYFEIGYRGEGNAGVQDRIMNKFGPGGQSGGYNRVSRSYTWPKDARPQFPEDDTIYFLSNFDTAGTGDTTKLFSQFVFTVSDSSEGRL